MSEPQDFSAYNAENQNQDSMAVLPAQQQDQPVDNTQSLNDIGKSLDEQMYSNGEVPQHFMVDPHAFLPLNSDRLIGAANMVDKLIVDVSGLVQEEINQIQKLQKKITFWEDRIEKNKTAIQKNAEKVKQNNIDIIYDKKNRDYWWGRAEQVNLDYQNAEAASRTEDWGWLIKKWGLKNPDGTVVDEKNACIEELCNGEASNLAGEYRTAGNKYEQSKKDKEAENNRLIRENSNYLASSETLQSYISATYVNEIEPYQDGVLLFKELGVKLKSMGGSQATYGELRNWAESFLNDFLKSNPRVHLSVVTEFRKLTSIPLPAENC